MPGPPPKVNPVRKNARTGPLKLPSEGRKDPPPSWPLPGEQSATEWDAWKQLWSTPQAVAWEQLGWTRTVARYCRVMVAAEEPGAAAMVMAEARQLEDRLGLTPKSMRMLLWEIAADEVGERRQGTSKARERIRAVG